MISVSASGSLDKINSFLDRMKRNQHLSRLEQYGQAGVDALARATPVDTKLTADSWIYEIVHTHGKHSIMWKNTNVNEGIPIAILIQYGHATGTGGWVEGQDYINPALHPIFDQIASDVWKEVIRNG